jgi:hypothetical protein
MYRYRYLITGTGTDACGSVGEAFSKEKPCRSRHCKVLYWLSPVFWLTLCVFDVFGSSGVVEDVYDCWYDKKIFISEVPDQPESFFKRRPVSGSARLGSRRRQLNTGADTLNRKRSDKVCGPETNSLDCYEVLHRYSIPVRRIRIRIRIWNSEDAKSWRIRIRIRDPSLRSRAQYTRHSLEGTEIDQSFKKTLPNPALRNLTISFF